jgi:UDP-glucose 4-epimerase
VGRRILLTGIQTFWGGRLARELERDPTVETIIGVGPSEPTIELERTEYVRVGAQHALLRRIVQAAEIDTVVTRACRRTRCSPSARDAHEINVIGTMNILAACGGPTRPCARSSSSPPRTTTAAERDDPGVLHREMQRPHPPRTRLEPTSSRPRAPYAASPSATATSR